tara:strand:- start:299 stop:478 length:180 start_codon:yes stop_codon:yes gene_type:complete
VVLVPHTALLMHKLVVLVAALLIVIVEQQLELLVKAMLVAFAINLGPAMVQAVAVVQAL